MSSAGINETTLRAGRDEIAARVAAGEGWGEDPELLGRAHVWLDEPEEARRWFRTAAEQLERDVEARGRGTARTRGQTGGLLHLAGDRDAARKWLEWALPEVEDGGRDEAAGAPLRYLLGDDDGVLDAVAAAADPSALARALADLARARRDRDAAAAQAALDAFVAALRAEGVLPPWQTSGSPHVTLWDWIAEAARVRAEAGGDAAPTHRALLEELGLWDEGARPRDPDERPDVNPPDGDFPLERTAPDGRTVTARVTVSDDMDVTFVVDAERGLELEMWPQHGEWVVERGGREVGRVTGFRAATTTLVADTLAAEADGPEHADWVRATLTALAEQPFVQTAERMKAEGLL